MRAPIFERSDGSAPGAKQHDVTVVEKYAERRSPQLARFSGDLPVRNGS
jgi:hypothetical protein